MDTQEFKINNNLSYQYKKPKLFEFITKIPNSFGIIGNMFMQKDNLIWFGASVGTTLAIITFDQKLSIIQETLANKLALNPVIIILDL